MQESSEGNRHGLRPAWRDNPQVGVGRLFAPGPVPSVLHFRDARSRNEIHVVADGEEALAFLKREGAHVNVPRPDIVFLDLSLPKVSGYEVLEAMKADPILRRIPVVAISGSSREIDIARAYDAQISAYLIKPTGVNEYFTAIRSLKELWFHAAALPPKEEATSA